MTDYFNPALPDTEIARISNLGLAHMGDVVYEILVRTWLCSHGRVTSRGLHRETVRYVSAPAQARAAARIQDLLTPEELAVFRRGRNARVHAIPQHADAAQYHAATGLETLFGWLYLRGEKARLNQLFSVIMEGEDDAA